MATVSDVGCCCFEIEMSPGGNALEGRNGYCSFLVEISTAPSWAVAVGDGLCCFGPAPHQCGRQLKEDVWLDQRLNVVVMRSLELKLPRGKEVR